MKFARQCFLALSSFRIIERVLNINRKFLKQLRNMQTMILLEESFLLQFLKRLQGRKNQRRPLPEKNSLRLRRLLKNKSQMARRPQENKSQKLKRLQGNKSLKQRISLKSKNLKFKRLQKNRILKAKRRLEIKLSQ